MVVMFVIAAVIEGYFTPLNIATNLKLFFAAITGILFIVYILGTKRKEKENRGVSPHTPRNF